MTIDNYINNLSQRYKLGNATEHTFRGDLQQLLETLVPSIRATNEPKRQSCGAPDYILTKKDIPVGFIEAKDIGDKDLDGKKKTGNKEQFDRYKASLDNLIFTDYINFHLYREGEFVTSIAIAEITENGIKALPENFANFDNLIKDFCVHIGQTIKSPKRLAEMMAGKARLLSDIIEKSLTSDEENQENSTLKEQMLAFKEILIHDITPQGFADVYAQTIAYGMFAARLHDPTLDNFSRQEAAELIPKSNPFLRKLFGYIAGPDIDDRIKWVVENLAEIFLACNVSEILKNYGKATKMEDPIIHFYETFLSEYDPKLRKARGVWYTPQPVVNFIVRAVDDILKTEFDLPQGLADTSKTEIKVDIQGKKVKQEVHKVQILDPATGTGTFLAETIKHIHKRFEGQQGIWSNYVETHLLPRLNGFELLMASYAMAHLKLDLLLTETGYRTTPPVRHPSKGGEQRLRVYLTNSLEEHHQDTGTLFANWLSTEANEANHIKRDTPVMCVIGNPPYSGESANKGEWIMSLMDDYKKEPGGKEKLKEQNSKFINDDYVKFLRYGQHFIEKNGSGVLAFINPHGFLDNPTFRGMRWHLLKTYDKIYTIDLHGNAKKKETAPDGTADVNVFDIEQGVSINFFIKTGKKKPNELGKVYHYDLYGKRELKYDFLTENSLKSTPYNEVELTAPEYFLMPKDFEDKNEYDKGFQLTELFIESSLGVLSKNDSVTIEFEKSSLNRIIENFRNLEESELRKIYNLKSDSRDWILSKAKEDLTENFSDNNFKMITYRPFDNRWTYFTGKPKGFFAYSQNRIMKNLRDGKNFAIISGRQGQAVGSMQWNLSFITNTISDQNIYYRGGGSVFPLYIYPETNGQQTIGNITERTPNFKFEIVKCLAEKIGLIFTIEKDIKDNTFAPIDILDYIYAVLHSPTYRSTYKEFLKIDFPRVPYPKDQDTFWQLVKLGGEIRQIHLLESPKVKQYITQYPINGNNEVTRKITKSSPGYVPDNETQGKVWINDEQYFENVPLVAWEFYIGGYQPAQKWLKDRKGRQLEFDDILHYQKIIVALSETDRLMKEIDKIEII
ncbi:type ISP restriction/modification enzyme [Psychroflexus maritimus]|uniref:site-specific DNA-methyltransferase (adenine-specific) n=1 Tax=Psychroflexus maritimus TaxID=2714865 RepID=A0A967ACZ3_9FLAO|nr:type ISP restriction/modification enzyme [Psychroflexus maritimus]NGZ89994.1 N-6 DNA methylase [Psychroflexus maritimus]